MHEYAESATIYIIERDLPELLRRAAVARLESSVRDDFDVLQLPGGFVDARLGTARSLPGRRLGPPAQAGRSGVFLLQFAGPITPEWKEEVAAENIKFVQYVPYNAYLVVGRPEDMNRVSRLAFVQFVDVFHAVLKSQDVPTEAGTMSYVLVSIGNVADAADALRTLERLSYDPISSEVVGEELQELRVRGTFDGADIEKITDERLVFAVSLYPQIEFSDERAAISLGPHVNSAGGLLPYGGWYEAWVTAVCPACSELNSAGFRVGLADAGFWAGPRDAQNAVDPGPSDLPNARITYGKDFVVDPLGSAAQTATAFDDSEGHGTAVASILAARPASGSDSAGFLYGIGVAPSAGVFVTKIDTRRTSTTPITRSAHDARASSVAPTYIQNHSYNAYSELQSIPPHCLPTAQPDGKYTITSQDFDRAVRDSDGDSSTGTTPITLVVSSGNQFQSGIRTTCTQAPQRRLTQPPATAKNVISVGGTETPRTSDEAWGCSKAGSTSVLNVEFDSKRGTVDDGWFKPDLMAPAANVALLRLPANAQTGRCRDFVDGPTLPPTTYSIGTGTSFAAPVGSAAALLASRAYSGTPGAASPALLKAIMVMAARSMKGGTDYADRENDGGAKSPATIVGAIPSQSQGFGRINLDDVLEPYPARSYFNEQEAIAVGETWSKTYKVHDGGKPVTVVLTWTDVPAQISSGDMITNPLVNDLDLTV